jgi:uncharacterized membrane protein
VTKTNINFIKVGIILIIIGFLYDNIFGGIPPQDPPKLLLEKYNRNVLIANTVMKLGVILTLIGLILKLFRNNKIDE